MPRKKSKTGKRTYRKTAKKPSHDLKKINLSEEQFTDVLNDVEKVFVKHKLSVPQVVVFTRTFFDSMIKFDPTAKRFNEILDGSDETPSYFG